METPKRQNPKRLPRPLVALAVLVTGGVTAYAMAKTNLRGPQTSWGTVENAVQQVWADPGAAQSGAQGGYAQPGGAMPPAAYAPAGQGPTGADPALNLPPGPGPVPPPAQYGAPTPGARAVAGMPGVPAIVWGATRPHPDRGACANCHTVMDRDGRPLPNVFSFSSMPHGFRGVCSNCHQVTVAMGASGRAVAAMMPPPPPPQATAPSWSPPQATAPSWSPPQATAPSQTAPTWGAPGSQAWNGPSGAPGGTGPGGFSAQQSWGPAPGQSGLAQQGAGPAPSGQWGGAQGAWAGSQPAPRVPNDAEWKGMEVRTSSRGVVVTKADGTAARMGVQPGDFVDSINAQTVRTMGDFIQATQNGRLSQGTMIAKRGDQRVAFELIPPAMGNGGQPPMGMGR